VDAVNYITDWIFTAKYQAFTHIDLAGRTQYSVTGLDQPTATVNGSCTRMIEGVYVSNDTTITNTYNLAVTAANLSIAKGSIGWDSNCPASGTVNLTVGHVWSWNKSGNFGTGSDNWTVNVTLSNGTATVNASNGTTNWQYTAQLCTMSGSTL
jgi:hypothetical protein